MGFDGVFSELNSRVLTHYTALRAIAEGAVPAPRTAIIYPVYGCNIDCLGCEYSRENSPGYVYFPHDRLLSVVDEMAQMGLEGIELCGGGEPSLYPQLCALVEHGRRLGLHFGILTNGIGIRADFLELAARELSYVRFSMDAATPETYLLARRPKGRNIFDDILANARKLIELRNQYGSSLRVSYKVLLSRVNHHEIEEAVVLAHRLGFDSVQFKALRLSEAEFSTEESAAADQRIGRLREEYRGRIVVVGSTRKEEMYTQCKLTPLQTVIDAYGDVYLCCYFTHRKESHRIGNILAQDFRTVWESERHQQARSTIEPSACNNLDCRFVGYHRIVDATVFAREGQFEFI